MPQGSFLVSQSATDPDLLVLSRDPSVQQVPAEQLNLLKNIYDLQTQINMISKRPQLSMLGRPSLHSTRLLKRRTKQYRKQLFLAAELGLASTNANADPGLADSIIALLRNTIVVNEAGRFKNAQVIQLGISCVLLTFFFVILGDPVRVIRQNIFELSHALWMLASASLGVWVSFIIRRHRYTIENIVSPDEDLLHPFIRNVFVASMTLFFALLLHKQFIIIQVGQFNPANWPTDLGLAIMLGGFCGLGELLVANRLSDATRQFFVDTSKR